MDGCEYTRNAHTGITEDILTSGPGSVLLLLMDDPYIGSLGCFGPVSLPNLHSARSEASCVLCTPLLTVLLCTVLNCARCPELSISSSSNDVTGSKPLLYCSSAAR